MPDLERISLGDTCDIKRKMAQGLAKNARTIVIVFLLFVVVVVMTTNIKLVTLTEIADLSLQFFLILSVSYGMYIICSGGGASSAVSTEAYSKAHARFRDLHDQILNDDLQTRLGEFCEHYIAEDLKSARMHYIAPAGLSYSEYENRWATLSDKELNLIAELTDMQKKAIRNANRVRPITLTPRMLLRELDRSSNRRQPFGIDPGLKRRFIVGGQLAKMTLVSVGVTFIALDLIIDATWTVFATVLLKLASVIFIGFTGFEDGYNNIIVDTVGYLNNQSDLMIMAMRYIETHPEVSIQEPAVLNSRAICAPQAEASEDNSIDDCCL